MSDNNFLKMNPLDGVFNELKKIIDTIVIKYNYIAEEYETFESSRAADGYIAAINKKDDFFSYKNYTRAELNAVGITDYDEIKTYLSGEHNSGYLLIPVMYREPLLLNRRKKIITEYEEGNDYYRTLHGLPPISLPSSKYIRLIDSDKGRALAKKYKIDSKMPIHEIRDHYNNESSGLGDYLISGLDSSGYIDSIIDSYPNHEYLNYLGTKRISIELARTAKNFQILYVRQTTVKDSLYDEFIRCYEQCRDYFVSTLYMRNFRSFIEHYDRFIGMCIMVMAIQKTLNQQFPLGIDREFYNDFTLKMLYEAYGIPYDMEIDQLTQKRIAQNLNLLIQKKATDKVIYDIADLLGYSNLDVYKYYLGKQRKFEAGAPVIKYTQKFNDKTGEYETVPDYEAMYDVYFQKVEIRETDFIRSFNSKVNKEDYEKVVSDDAFWWKDSDLYKQVWETEYNFVESKYLSLAVSYKMTEILYENTILLKMLIDKDKQTELNSIKIKLPKIVGDMEVSLFDTIILLFCLTAKSHHLRGEIITIPTQVLDVLEYMKNTDPDSENDYLVDAFSFDFNLFKPDNEEGQELIQKVQKIFEDESGRNTNKFLSLIEQLIIDPDLENYKKVDLINEIFTNIKGLDKLIQYKLSETQDKEVYDTLKEFHRAAFYARETKDLFTINYDTEYERTAFTFFEFLYEQNPKLYGALFTPNYEGQYYEYLESIGKMDDEYTFEEFLTDVQSGSIEITYSTLNTENPNILVREEMLYYYVDHIIARLKIYIKNLKFINLINNTASALDRLLVRLILFFKSFTVDIIGLDTIYIMDMKVDNIVRMFDEPNRLIKFIEPHDYLNFPFADTVVDINASNIKKDKSMKLTDKVFIYSEEDES